MGPNIMRGETASRNHSGRLARRHSSTRPGRPKIQKYLRRIAGHQCRTFSAGAPTTASASTRCHAAVFVGPPAMSKPQPRPEPETPPARPVLADDPPRFLLLEREVEIEFRPQMLTALQRKVNAVAEAAQATLPLCPHCGKRMRCQDTRSVSWLARCGCLHAPVSRYRCPVTTSAGLYWICWEWNPAASAAR